MLKVALTGGIGSGKSLVGQFLQELGAIVFDADQLARDVVERGTTGFNLILKRFGDEILSEGEINRAKLAEIVFNDSAARKDLEAIVHPLVKEAGDLIIKTAPTNAVVVNQIPLVYETNGAHRFDFIITVEAPEALRYERLRARGLKDFEIAKRMSAQATRTERASIANLVIENDGDKDQLLRKVESAWESELAPRAAQSE